MVTPVTDGLKPALRKPCPECPFRRAALGGWLGGTEIPDYIRAAHSDIDVACHTSPGYQDGIADNLRSCKGLAIYRCNVGKLPRGGSAAKAVRESARDTETVFASPMEFMQHHAGQSK